MLQIFEGIGDFHAMIACVLVVVPFVNQLVFFLHITCKCTGRLNPLAGSKLLLAGMSFARLGHIKHLAARKCLPTAACAQDEVHTASPTKTKHKPPLVLT